MTCHYSVLCSFGLFVGRVCVSMIFIVAGYMKIMTYNATLAVMTHAGIPATELMLVLAIVFEFGGGVLLLLGLYTRFAALMLVVFIVVATYYFHTFWDDIGQQAIDNTQHFLKNLTMVGALIYVFCVGAGSWSLDRLVRKCGKCEK